MASICRFYPAYRLEHVGRLTFKEFSGLNRNIVVLSKMENPTGNENSSSSSSEPQPLSAANLPKKINKVSPAKIDMLKRKNKRK